MPKEDLSGATQQPEIYGGLVRFRLTQQRTLSLSPAASVSLVRCRGSYRHNRSSIPRYLVNRLSILAAACISRAFSSVRYLPSAGTQTNQRRENKHARDHQRTCTKQKQLRQCDAAATLLTRSSHDFVVLNTRRTTIAPVVVVLDSSSS